MNWGRIDPGELPEALLALGVRFHGHLGPFLVAGLRMGSLALRLLKHPGYHGIRATVETGSDPPLSCLADGIQVASGCTVGKGNLKVVDQGRPRVRFRTGDRELVVELRGEPLSRFLGAADPEGEARWALFAPEEELFRWELRPSS